MRLQYRKDNGKKTLGANLLAATASRVLTRRSMVFWTSSILFVRLPLFASFSCSASKASMSPNTAVFALRCKPQRKSSRPSRNVQGFLGATSLDGYSQGSHSCSRNRVFTDSANAPPFMILQASHLSHELSKLW